MKLNELLNSVDYIRILGSSEDKEITGLSSDSREISDGKIFFAISGYSEDGVKYIPEALKNGALAIVSDSDALHKIEHYNSEGAVFIIVDDIRFALAQFSHIYYGKPSEKLTLVGITGTKGKTTTS